MFFAVICGSLILRMAGATSTCSSGQGWIDNVCTACPAGTYASNNLCKKVPIGFYNPNVGSTGYLTCASSVLSGAASCFNASNPLSVLAGSLTGVSALGDGVGTNSFFRNPIDLTIDTSSGDIYISDYNNHAIRKVSSSLVVTTFAGSLVGPSGLGSSDGVGTNANFNCPVGICRSSVGDLYVADKGNQRIRKITSNREVSTLAGSSNSYQDGTGTTARFASPFYLKIFREGELLVSDYDNHKLRKVTLSGVVTTFSGPTSGTSSGYVDGAATNCKYFHPEGLDVEPTGNVILADMTNSRLRRIFSNGYCSTLAGSGTVAALDGVGTTASFSEPYGVVVTSAGVIYVTDSTNNNIRRVTASGQVSTVTVTRTMSRPAGIAIDSSGDAYVTEYNGQRINKIKIVSCFSGHVSSDSGTCFSVAAGYYSPYNFSGVYYYCPTASTSGMPSCPSCSSGHVANYQCQACDWPFIDGDGVNCYTSCVVAGQGLVDNVCTACPAGTYANNSLCEKVPTGYYNSNVGSTGYLTCSSSVLSGAASCFNVTNPTEIIAGSPSGANGITDGFGTNALFRNPVDLIVDTVSGVIYVVDDDNNAIRMISSSLLVKVLAGAGSPGSNDGMGTNAKFNSPRGIRQGSVGDFFVTDKDNHRVRRIASNREVTTLAGSSQGYLDGTETSCRFNNPVYVTMSMNGELVVSDRDNRKLRRITMQGVVTTFSGSTLDTFSGYQDGSATNCRYDYLSGLDTEPTGKFIVVDTNNYRLRRVFTNGDCSTLAGSGSAGSSDGIGSTASFALIYGVAVASTGTIFVTDRTSNKIRRVTSSGHVATVLLTMTVSAPQGIGLDSSESILITESTGHRIDKIRSVQCSSGEFVSVGICSSVSIGYYSPYNTSGVYYYCPTASSTGMSYCPTCTSGHVANGHCQACDLPYVDGDGVNCYTLCVLPGQGFIDNVCVACPAGTYANNSLCEKVPIGHYNPNIGSTGYLTCSSSVLAGAASCFNISNPISIAGSLGTSGNDDGVGANSRFKNPEDLTVDRISGDIYVSDHNNHAIRKISSSLAVTTLAGSPLGSSGSGSNDGTGTNARFFYPRGIRLSSVGDLYVMDELNHRVRKISSQREVSTLAGSLGGYQDGTGTNSMIAGPYFADLSFEVLLISDGWNNKLRKVTLAGVVTTFSGSTTNTSAGYQDGTASNCKYNAPMGISMEPFGSYIVADTNNFRLRRVFSNGDCSTLVGSGVAGSSDGIGTAAIVSWVYGVAVSSSGIIYVADYGYDNIRRVTSSGHASTLVFSVTLSGPQGIFLDADGNLGVTETNGHRISRILLGPCPSGEYVSAGGACSSVPKGYYSPYNTSGVYYYCPTASNSGMSSCPSCTSGHVVNYECQPVTSCSVAGEGIIGNVCTACPAGTYANSSLCEKVPIGYFNPNIGSTGYFACSFSMLPGAASCFSLSTVGSPSGDYGNADGMGTNARFNGPVGLSIDTSTGDIYVTEFGNHAIRKISSVFAVTTLAGSPFGSSGYGTNDGTGSNARFHHPRGIRLSSLGDLFVIDGNNHRVRKISSSREVSSLAGSSQGYQDGTGTNSMFSLPHYVVIVVDGLLVSDYWNHKLRKLTLSGVVTTFSGSTSDASSGYQDGAAASCRYYCPMGLDVEPAGKFIVTDRYNYRLRRVDSNGDCSTLAGSGISGSSDGVWAIASFTDPWGVVVTSVGVIFVSEYSTNKIRRVRSSGEVFSLALQNVLARPTGIALDSSGTMYIADYDQNRIAATEALCSVGGFLSLGGTCSTLGIGYFSPHNASGMYYYCPTAGTTGLSQCPACYSGYGLTNGECRICPKGSISDGNECIPTPIGLFAPSTGLAAAESCFEASLTGASSCNDVPHSHYVTSIVAGGGETSLVDGVGTNATFHFPGGIYLDSISGDIYVADVYNNVIRKVTSSRFDVSVYAGSNGGGFSDGLATQTAEFEGPRSLVKHPVTGALLVVDSGNNRIRVISSNGAEVTTLAGSSEGDALGTFSQARFRTPQYLAFALSNDVIVSDFGNHKLKRLNSSGFVVDFGVSCNFSGPMGIAVESSGSIIVGDQDEFVLRRVFTNENCVVLAGANQTGAHRDGIGSVASFGYINQIAISSSGTIFVAQSGYAAIRVTTSSGNVSTIVSSGAITGSPLGIAVDQFGNLYVTSSSSNRLFKIEDVKLPCPPGSAFEDSVCRPVQSGYYNPFNSSGVYYYCPTANITGMSHCPVCYPGYGLANGECRVCPPGTYSHGDDICTAVPKGYYASMEGSSGYLECLSSEYSGGASCEVIDFYYNVSIIGSVNRPVAVTVDSTNGDIFIASEAPAIYKVNSSLQFSQVAGLPSAGYSKPIGLLMDESLLYVVDCLNQTIRRMSSDGVLRTLAGSSVGYQDGTGTMAMFSSPRFIEKIPSGQFLVTERNNHMLRKLTSSGNVTSFSGSTQGFQDGLASNCQYNWPEGLALESTGSVIVVDRENNRIRRVFSDGSCSTIAGSAMGLAGGFGTMAQFSAPVEAVVSNGLIFVTDSGNDRICSITSSGLVTTFFGNEKTFAILQSGPLSRPHGLGVDASGNLIVTDYEGMNIRKIFDIYPNCQPGEIFNMDLCSSVPIGYYSPNYASGVYYYCPTANMTGMSNCPVCYPGHELVNGECTTCPPGTFSHGDYCQAVPLGYYSPSSGSSDYLLCPQSMQAGAATCNDIYSYEITTLAGTANVATFADGVGTQAKFNAPNGVTTDPHGNVYVADLANHVIRKISSSLQVTVFAGRVSVAGNLDGNRSQATLNGPKDIVYHPTRFLFVVVESVGETVRNVSMNGTVTTMAGSTNGYQDGIGSNAKFSTPNSLTLVKEDDDAVVISDASNHRIRKLFISSGTVITFSGSSAGYQDGSSSNCKFGTIVTVAADPWEAFMVADRTNLRIRRVFSDGSCTTFAGSGLSNTLDGIGAVAAFTDVGGLAVHPLDGTMYVSDHSVIRRVSPDGMVETILGNGLLQEIDGSGTSAGVNGARFLSFAAAGNFVFETETVHVVRRISRVRKVCSTGEVVLHGLCRPAPRGYFSPTNSSGVHYYCPNANVSGMSYCPWCPFNCELKANGRCEPCAPGFLSLGMVCFGFPTSLPSSRPSNQPESNPSSPPISSPSSTPTMQPFGHPTGMPSAQPLSDPSSIPSAGPSSQPTSRPTCRPSSEPSTDPTSSPTSKPSSFPTTTPTSSPTVRPSSDPTSQPTAQPSSRPTSKPSSDPTSIPSSGPTSKPSTEPTSIPSSSPSSRPSSRPSTKPTSIPSSGPTSRPSSDPSSVPSSGPTSRPSGEPTSIPSSRPSSRPTTRPSSDPTSIPSSSPSSVPTSRPSTDPTSIPSSGPTSKPSTCPSSSPSSAPTSRPSTDPTSIPSSIPTSRPSTDPTSIPSSGPTSIPSTYPTSLPSSTPSSRPTSRPSSDPTVIPSSSPSSEPTSRPSTDPTSIPSSGPTSRPSAEPTSIPSSTPSSAPSSRPSAEPTSVPSSGPTSRPSTHPTSLPSSSPSSRPTSRPSSEPTAGPSTRPSSRPSLDPTAQPTSSPSSQPSRQPSSRPTAAALNQRVNSTVAAVKLIRIQSVNKTSASIEVLVPEYSGTVTVYCLAYSTLSSQKKPNSTLEVILHGVQNIVMNGIATVEYGALSPATSYRAYCTTLDSNGNYLPIQAVLALFVDWHTLCCKTLRVSISSQAVRSADVLPSGVAVTVDALPISLLKVNIGYRYAADSSEAKAPVISPNSTLFSKYSPLERYLTLAAGSSGLLVLNVTIYGPDQNDYKIEYSSGPSLRILSRTSEPPTPALSSAFFNADGTLVQVRFSADTNKGGVVNNFECAKLLSFVGSGSSQCYWHSSLEIRIVSSALTVGSLISLAPSSYIRAACPRSVEAKSCSIWNVSDSSSVLIVSAPNPTLPKVVIAAENVIYGCSDFTLDLTKTAGSGGRAWKTVEIVVTASDGRNISSMQSPLSKVSSIDAPLRLPNALFHPGVVYSLAVTLCNFLSACGRGSHSVFLSNSSSVAPVVRLLGPDSMTMYKYQKLQILCEAYVPSCGTRAISYDNLQFAWTLTSESTTSHLLLATSDPRRVWISPFTLESLRFYEVKVTATHKISGQSAAAIAFVKVLQSNLLASISGSVDQLIRKNSTLPVDASSSKDPDLPDSSFDSELRFQWNVFQLAPFYEIGGPLILKNSTTSSSRVNVYSGAALVNSTTNVILVVSKGAREASISLKLTVIAPLAPLIQFVTSDKSVSGVDTSTKLTLSASISSRTASCNAVWSVDDPLLSLKSAALTPLIASVTSASPVVLNLVLAAGVLPVRSTLTFQLHCGPSSAKIVVSTNGPPVLGSFAVSPSGGTALTTQFQYLAVHWVDDNSPITYQFGYFPNGGSNVSQIVRSRQELSHHATLLPSGASSRQYGLRCFAQIFDSLGASSLEPFDVVVNRTASLALLQISQTLSNVSSSVAASKEAICVLATALNQVDCSGAPNCGSLNREACYSTYNTCGKCKEGFTGNRGDSNAACLNASHVFTEQRTAPIGNISVSCTSDIHCPSYQYCNSTICAMKLKSCPNNCNGHGTCVVFDANSGESVSSCSLFDGRCEAQCRCHNDFSGPDCTVATDELAKLQLNRQIMFTSLSDVVSKEEANLETLRSWMSTLISLTSVPEELTPVSLNITQSLVESVLTKASVESISTASIDGIASVIDSIGIYTYHIAARLNESNSHEIGARSLELLSSYSEMLSRELSAGEPDLDLLGDTFRMVSRVAAAGPHMTITLPQSLIEQEFNKQPFSASIAATSDSISHVSMVSTSMITYGSALRSNFLSSPVQLEISSSSLSDNAAPQYVIFTLPREARLPALDEFENVTTSCQRGLAVRHAHVCATSLFVVEHNCSGSRNYTMLSACPRVSVEPRCGDIPRIGGKRSSNCRTVGYTSSAITCNCSFERANERQAERKRRLTVESVETVSASTVGMILYIQQEFTGTLLTIESFNAVDALKKALMVVLLFSVMWGSGLLLLGWFEWGRWKRRERIEVSGATSRPAKSAKEMKRQLLKYIGEISPKVFEKKSATQRLLYEVVAHHRYFVMFATLAGLSQVRNRVLTGVHLLTIQTMLMFLLAVFYELQAPDDNGSCNNITSESVCLQRRSFLDSNQFYCDWDSRDQTCSYRTPTFKWLTIAIIGIVVSMFTALINYPIDLVFDALAAPVADLKKIEKLQHPENMIARAQRRLSNVARRASAAIIDVIQAARRLRVTKRIVASAQAGYVTREFPESALVAYEAMSGNSAVVQQRSTQISTRRSQFRSMDAHGAVAEHGVISTNLFEISATELPPEYVDYSSIMDLLKQEIRQQHAFLPEELKSQFEYQWMLDRDGEFGNIQKKTWWGIFRRKVYGGDLVDGDIRSCHDGVLSAVKRLEVSKDCDIGLELVHLFILDLLGRDTVSARIFRAKAVEDFKLTSVASISTQMLFWTFIFLLNIFFVLFVILRANQRHARWQQGYVTGCIVQFIVEIFLNETLECIWVNFFVPTLAAEEIVAALDVLKSAAAKMSLENFAESKQYLNAPDYLFVSTNVAKHFPDLCESMIIQSYQDYLPGELHKKWRACKSSTPRKQSFLLSCLRFILTPTTALVVALQIIVTWPFVWQRAMLRLAQPWLLTSISLALYYLAKDTLIMAVTLACLFFLLGFGYMRAANPFREKEEEDEEDPKSRQNDEAPVGEANTKVNSDLDLKENAIGNSALQGMSRSVDTRERRGVPQAAIQHSIRPAVELVRESSESSLSWGAEGQGSTSDGENNDEDDRVGYDEDDDEYESDEENDNSVSIGQLMEWISSSDSRSYDSWPESVGL